MPTPSTRTPVRIARGSYSNLNSSISDLGDGEIVYAEDQDKLYVKEGSSLVVLTQPAASPTFTGDVTINAQGDLRFADSDSSNYVGFQSPATVSSNLVWTLPAADGSANQLLKTDGSGNLGWATDSATDSTKLPLAGGTMSGDINLGTNDITNGGTITGTFSGNLTGNVTGNADTATNATNATNVTVADESSDTTCFPLFATTNTGTIPPKVGSNLTFNSSSGALTATSFVGDLTGAVTGTASGNAVLTGSTNNEIVTVTGANAIQGEAKLTFNGATLDFAINNSQQGFKIGATGNHIPLLSFDSNRTAAGDNVGQQKFFWNGTEVARIAGLSGGDTTNKDDGKLAFYTRASGSSLAASLTLDTDQSATFAGTVSDSKGDLRKIPASSKSSAYTLVATDTGKVIYISSGGVTVNGSVMSGDEAVTIINNSGSDQTITQGSGMTMYNTADASTGNRTLAQRGMATLWFSSSSTAYISGAGLS